MGERRRRGLRTLCALVFCAALAALALLYKPAPRPEAFVSTPGPGPAETAAPSPTPWHPGLAVDFEALRRQNPDIVGWLCIWGTRVNGPVAQGADDRYYETHAFDGAEDRHGTLFLDSAAAGDFSDKNSVIYGHNMLDDSMFGDLDQYYRQDFFDQPAHRYIYLYTPEGVRIYRIFSVYVTEAWSQSYTRVFRDSGDFGDFVRFINSQNTLQTRDSAAGTDRILTLSTCTERAEHERLVIHGRLLY